ncbi:hypothetical protein V8E36_007504 [Tilletia maclaganii]
MSTSTITSTTVLTPEVTAAPSSASTSTESPTTTSTSVASSSQEPEELTADESTSAQTSSADQQASTTVERIATSALSTSTSIGQATSSASSESAAVTQHEANLSSTSTSTPVASTTSSSSSLPVASTSSIATSTAVTGTTSASTSLSTSTSTSTSTTATPEPTPTVVPTSTDTQSEATATTSSTSTTTPDPMATDNSPEEQQAVVDNHNRYRAKHDAPALTWDDTLAKAAHDWASQCHWAHSGGPYGENGAATVGMDMSMTIAADMWYDEIKQYNFTKSEFSEATGHFTQLVWKGTTKIGCSIVECTPEQLGFYWPYPDPAYNVWCEVSLSLCATQPHTSIRVLPLLTDVVLNSLPTQYDQEPGNWIGEFSWNVLPPEGVTLQDGMVPSEPDQQRRSFFHGLFNLFAI